MKKIFYLVFIKLIVFHLNAQVNLVPNPSFENITQCPNNPAQVNFAVPWKDPTHASSDLFNSCNINDWGVPNNLGGYQMARSGQSYVGFATYYAGSSTREYIQVKLDSILHAGKNYYVEFYVSLSDTQRVACNNMGAYFSSTAITGPAGPVLNVAPQINNDPIANPLTDYNGWTKISGIFTASGNEQYITIGNFLNDASSDTVLIGGGCSGCNAAYYYTDDVTVKCMNCAVQTGIDNHEDDFYFKIYPNPSNGIINIEYRLSEKKSGSLKIFDLTGRKVSERLLERTEDKIIVNETNLQAGLYFYSVVINDQVRNTGRIVVEKQ
jgi:hypothetical protein